MVGTEIKGSRNVHGAYAVCARVERVQIVDACCMYMDMVVRHVHKYLRNIYMKYMHGIYA